MLARWDLTTETSEEYDRDLIAQPSPDLASFAEMIGYQWDFDNHAIQVRISYKKSDLTPIRVFDVVVEGSDYDAFLLSTVPPGAVAESVASFTANSGSATTITKTGAGWTVNAKAGLVVSVTGGTNNGKQRVIASNTSDTITFDTMTTACDGTTVCQFDASALDVFHKNLLTKAMAVAGLAGTLV